ncbi:ABC transporter permease [Halalkalibacterium halodurans]|uniref:ABC transporter permease n=1 Tax=Halalkalibacterium halodurans TaxID=86665 RepID=UPI002E1BEB2F|nr:ABC transporter permease [Halalkalibacterium halodurans]
MRAILWNYWRHLIYRPWYVVGFFILTATFAFVTGQSSFSKVEVPVYVEGMSSEETAKMLGYLNEHKRFDFQLMNQEEIETGLRQHEMDFAIALKQDDFRMLSSAETVDVNAVFTHLMMIYQEQQIYDQAADHLSISASDIRTEVDRRLANPAYKLEKQQAQEEKDFKYDQGLQSLFGFSLYFAIMTVSFTVSMIVQEKQNGLWDRVMLSPLRKTQIYLGHLSYSFLLGYGQLALLFSFFHYLLGVNFYGGFPMALLALAPYVFAIVSLGVLLSSFVTNARRLDAVIPLVSTSMAMVGGAFWPLEIVQSSAMLFVSKFAPITYGMELLKGVTINQAPIHDVLFHAAVLFLMGVLFMGIGLNVMERKASS